MSSITWLHISDLHWRESEAYDANVVAGALLQDLSERTARIAPEVEHIDFIFVTGDIAFASKPEEYVLAQRFFDELRRVTKVRKDRLFIVPGNHDVDREAISDEARDVMAELNDREAVNQLLGNDVHRAIVMQRFHRYKWFMDSYMRRYLPFDSGRYFYKRERQLAGKRIAILGLNSAWASASDADQLNLFLGECQARAVLRRARRSDIRIALIHHPFEWLRDSDRNACEPLLFRDCDFVLHGHLHRRDLIYRQSPGSRVMVIGAGACYDTREHPNAYNLVRFDVDSRQGTIYLRMYSDRQGGFWTKDLVSYQDAPGEYVFSLPLETAPTLSSDTSAEETPLAVVVPQIHGDAVEAVPAVRPRHLGLDQWWAERGYRSNPFIWSNAADVGGDFSDLFEAWHIDPNAVVDLADRGPVPTLDKIISLETSKLVLVYASAGSGKTFYRRFAAHQIEEAQASECTLEISNIAARVADPENVTARDLALCIHSQIGEISSQPSQPPDAHVEHILEQCEDMLKPFVSGSQRRVYVFVDDVNQLFDGRPSRAIQNTRALQALLDFCAIVAARGGGEFLALRLFVPAWLREPIQQGLGEERHERIVECVISWGARHCHSVIERRLNNCWCGDHSPGLIHISRLLTQDALGEFLDWLQEQGEAVSPRCVIKVFAELALYAYGRGVTTDQIGVELWNEFVNSDDSRVQCAQDVSRPLVTAPASDQYEYDAFISYSHRDEKWVRDWLLPRLQEDGLRICIDFRDFEPGAPSITEMERAVLQSRKTLLVLTPNYLDSEWTEFENILAATLDPAARRRRIIPLLLEQCELPLRIRTLTYIDFASSDHESQLQRLLASVRRQLPGGSEGKD